MCTRPKWQCVATGAWVGGSTTGSCGHHECCFPSIRCWKAPVVPKGCSKIALPLLAATSGVHQPGPNGRMWPLLGGIIIMKESIESNIRSHPQNEASQAFMPALSAERLKIVQLIISCCRLFSPLSTRYPEIAHLASNSNTDYCEASLRRVTYSIELEGSN